MKWSKSKIEIFASVALSFVALFFAAYRLTESPPTWMDEGIIINSARVLGETGRIGLQVAPGVYESAGVVTTAYPVTAPIALSFRLFGESLFSARLVMVAYLALLLGISLFFLKMVNGSRLYVLGFAILVLFPPIYGHGKNVLGEIPGMFYCLLFLSLFSFAMKEQLAKRKYGYSILSGLALGLFVSTKPIFILILPALIGAFLFYFIFSHKVRMEARVNNKYILISAVAFVIPLFVWVQSQFSGDSILHILSVYNNPGKVDTLHNILANIRLLVTEAQPLYFLLALIIWSAALIAKIWKRDSQKFDLVQLTAWIFSVLILVSFLRLPGYYRYFFPAQFLALLYLMSSLQYLRGLLQSERAKAALVYGTAGLFVIINAYGLLFNSWVHGSYGSRQTEELVSYFREKRARPYFLYQAPELATFVPDNDYYQYFAVAPELPIGTSSLRLLRNGADFMVIAHDESRDVPELSRYKKVGQVARYAILEVDKDKRK